LIRTLAPLLCDKQQEPPVLAVAEDGSAVVPLLGGLSGVNEIARHIAQALGVNPDMNLISTYAKLIAQNLGIKLLSRLKSPV